LFVLSGTGEVTALYLYAEVPVEPGGDAHGRIGVVDTLEFVAVDAAVEWMEVAVATVDVDAGVNMLFSTLYRLCRRDRCSNAESEKN